MKTIDAETAKRTIYPTTYYFVPAQVGDAPAPTQGGLEPAYWYAFLPDFGHSTCSATGDTLEDALQVLRTVKRAVIDHFVATGRPIPAPSPIPGNGPPPQRMLQVACVVLQRGDQVLLIQRRDTLKWGAPGGKVRWSEQPIGAARREAQEELGVRFVDNAGPVVEVATFVATGLHVTKFYWLADRFTPEPTNCAPNEHVDMRWFEFDQMPEEEMMPGDASAIRDLVWERRRAPAPTEAAKL